MTETTPPPLPQPRRRLRKWLVRFAVLFVFILVVAELVLRFYYGFGDPPLFVTHPTIEYLHKPSSSYQRFGNFIAFNSHSMRSEEFPKTKSDPKELRILVIGDSIINGGAWTDQHDIATEVLKRNLQKRFPDRRVIVGNISTTSWGPENMLAYLQTFGLFDADAIFIVLASEDYADAPTFEPLSYERPSRKPLLALQDVLVRYTPAMINYFQHGSGPITDYKPPAEDVESSMQAVRDLIDLVRSKDIPISVLQHMERIELMSNGPKPGYLAFQQLLNNRRVPVIDVRKPFVESVNEHREPFRDWVHPNAIGQQIIAEQIEAWLVRDAKIAN